jgi:hypothetical protein
MSARTFLLVCVLAFASSMACGRSKLRDSCPACGQSGRDAPGPDTSDGSASGSAAETAGDGSEPEAARDGRGPETAGDGTLPDESAANCGTVMVDFERRAPNLLIVLDRSESMTLSWTEDAPCAAGSACISRWQVMRNTLKSMLETGAYIRWGLKLYPSPGAGTCGVEDGVEFALALDSSAAIAAQIDDSVTSGSAPVGDALRRAGKYLQGINDSYWKGILLVTSGAADCVASNATVDAGSPEWSASALDAVQAVREVQGMFIPVYVLSLDNPANTGAQAYLNALASAGGTGSYYEPKDFLNALFYPVDFPPTCMISMVNVPPDPDNITVWFNGEIVPRDLADLEGWDYVSPSVIQLYGAYCDKKLTLDSVKLAIVFGCPQV